MSGICVALSKATAQIVGECSYLQAVHLGDEYMVHQALPESTSGHVLRLRHVCWLDIHASFYGVLPGHYQVLWRTRKDGARPVGMANSPVHMSVSAHRVHKSNIGWQDEESQTEHRMQHFNNLPAGQWVDVPGGEMHVGDFANIDVKLYCHSGEWKSGLAWDYVKLVNLDQPTAIQPNVQHAAPSPFTAASNGVTAVIQDLWTAFNRLRQQ